MILKRKTLLKRLRELIPSLNRVELLNEYDREIYLEKNNEGYLCKDNDNIPWVIPQNFQVGHEMVYNGVKYYSCPNKNLYGVKRATIEIQDFKLYGNTHCYGKLTIDGVKWDDGTGRSVMTDNKEFPLVKHLYNINITKILSQEDISKENEDWCGYYEGSISERFSNIKELIITTLYVALSRIDGSFILFEGSPCCLYKKSEALLIVDDNDNVKINLDKFNINLRKK